MAIVPMCWVHGHSQSSPFSKDARDLRNFSKARFDGWERSKTLTSIAQKLESQSPGKSTMEMLNHWAAAVEKMNDFGLLDDIAFNWHTTRKPSVHMFLQVVCLQCRRATVKMTPFEWNGTSYKFSKRNMYKFAWELSEILEPLDRSTNKIEFRTLPPPTDDDPDDYDCVHANQRRQRNISGSGGQCITDADNREILAAQFDNR